MKRSLEEIQKRKENRMIIKKTETRVNRRRLNVHNLQVVAHVVGVLVFFQYRPREAIIKEIHSPK